MEELLNNLISNGWNPFGEGTHRSPYKKVFQSINSDSKRKHFGFMSNNHTHYKILRDIVSKESGLRQFVCENGMIFDSHYVRDGGIDNRYDYGIRASDYKFRLIESALKDESELEQFLLDNINVGND